MRVDWWPVLPQLGGVMLALSLLLALLLSQAALTLGERVAETSGAARAAWAAVGSVGLGSAIWTADVLASVAVSGQAAPAYERSTGSAAVALAVLGSLTLLAAVPLRRPGWQQIPGGALLAGLAFAGMHHAGLLALGERGALSGDWRVPATTAALWVALCGAGLWLTTGRRSGRRPRAAWVGRAGWALLVPAVIGTTALFPFITGAIPGGTSPSSSRVLRLPIETQVAGAAAVAGALIAMMLAAAIDRRIRLRRAETEALRRSEDRFRSLVQASAQIVWTTAPDGRMLGEQSSWAEFTGQDAKAYHGWGWFNAVHPEDRERTARIWEETLANRRSAELEHRVRRYDGRYRDSVVRVVPVLERDGRVREWVATHTDVTERTRMQEERELLAEAGRVLSSSLDYHETLGSLARLLVPRVADWCAIDVRADGGSLQRLVSAHQDPSRSARLQELHPESASGPEHGTMHVLRTGQSELIGRVSEDTLAEIATDAEAARQLRELGIRSILWVPLPAGGQVLGVLTLALAGEDDPYDLRDVALAEELARRAAVAIDNARLYSASQSAIRARDEVLGVVSHDLRNPLGTIATTADLLLELPLGPAEQRRHLEIIRRSARTAHHLIRDLLDVSQSESGQLSVDPHPADASRLVSEACEAMQPLAAERGQRLTWEVEDRLPLVLADAARIQQVLSNLIGNAIKFVPPDGTIRVLAGAVEGGVRISVLDTGPGIDANDLPHLFDRHWRARKSAHLGAGLGLAISRGIVEAHRGRIWVESEAGSGAAFHLELPVADRSPSGRNVADRDDAAPTPTVGWEEAAPEREPGMLPLPRGS